MPAEEEEEPEEIAREVAMDVGENENLESEDDESKDGKLHFPEWQKDKQTTAFGEDMAGVEAEDTDHEDNGLIFEEDEENANIENVEEEEIGGARTNNEEKDGRRAKSGKPSIFARNGQALSSGGGKSEASSSKRSASELELQESPPKRSR